MKLTRYEMETIIVFNEEEKTASVSTFKRIKRILDKCVEENNSDVSANENGDYTLPKSWIKIRPPRKMTEAQKEELRERGKRLFASRKQTNEES